MKYLFYIVIFSGIGCGLLVPQLEVCKPAVPYLIGFLLFLNFLEITVKWEKFFRVELLVTVSLSALLMPLLFFSLLSSSLHMEYRVGLLLTAVAPSSVMMLILSRFVPHKDYSLIVSNFFVTIFGSIFYVPFVVKWLVGITVQINIMQLFSKTAALVLLPYCISVIVKKVISEDAATTAKRYAKSIILVPIFIIIAVSIAGAAQEIIWDQTLIKLTPLVLSVFFVQGGLAYLAGLLFWDKSIRNTLTMIASARNMQLMLGIAIINFPPLVVVPCVLGIIFQNIIMALWLWLFRK